MRSPLTTTKPARASSGGIDAGSRRAMAGATLWHRYACLAPRRGIGRGHSRPRQAENGRRLSRPPVRRKSAPAPCQGRPGTHPALLPDQVGTAIWQDQGRWGPAVGHDLRPRGARRTLEGKPEGCTPSSDDPSPSVPVLPALLRFSQNFRLPAPVARDFRSRVLAQAGASGYDMVATGSPTRTTPSYTTRAMWPTFLPCTLITWRRMSSWRSRPTG